MPQVDYAQDKLLCTAFLREFEDVYADAATGAGMWGSRKYMTQLQGIANRTGRALAIDLDDVQAFEKAGDGGMLLQQIHNNTKRMTSLFAQAADELMPASNTDAETNTDVLDVLLEQRNASVDGQENTDKSKFPPELMRRYDVVLKCLTKTKPCAIRGVRSCQIGHLCKVKGMVTRISDVKPMLTVATYIDANTGYEIYQEVNGPTYMPLQKTPVELEAANPGAFGAFCDGSRLFLHAFQVLNLLPSLCLMLCSLLDLSMVCCRQSFCPAQRF
jgi:DNA replication licensing factor MCM7